MLGSMQLSMTEMLNQIVPGNNQRKGATRSHYNSIWALESNNEDLALCFNMAEHYGCPCRRTSV